MQTVLTEDDVYRASTQYRLWSFTPEALASLRATTNRTASERVVAALKRVRDARGDHTNGDTPTSAEPDVDTLTVAEELKLIEYYSEALLRAGDTFHFPTAVKATAVQYLKRFYLSNSPMTYHPRQIFPACLFLATKTEGTHIALADFAAKFPKTTTEDIIAPEFILTQALRFTFDVRHPYRALRGGLMELLAMARGQAMLLPALGKTPVQVQQEMTALPPPEDRHVSTSSDKTASEARAVKDLENRCGAAGDRARDILSAAALLTDAYFLYTPAQIWLAAFMLADEPLANFYLSTKFPISPVARKGGELGNGEEEREEEREDEAAMKQQHKAHILARLSDCAELLSSYTPSSAAGPAGKEELVRIDKKLYQCQNPEKKDLVGLNRAQKRGDDDAEERAAKKRKLEREEAAREGEEVFGGPLVGATKDSG